MDISIIIVNWRVRELLRACLLSVFANTRLPGTRFEVIVVDNDSGDGSAAMVHACFPGVVLIENLHNVGFGAANNQALSYCRGRYVLLLNPDTLASDGAVDCMFAFMEGHPDVGAMGCRLLNADGTLQRWTGGAFPTLTNAACHYLFFGRILPLPLRPPPLYLDRDEANDLDVDWVSGACMILRREVLETRIFNEDYFMYGEDMELCWRLKKAGWRVVYSPTVSILHYQGQSMKQQSGEVMLSSLKGLRIFFRQTHSGIALATLDTLTAAGFLLRWLLYGLAYGLSARNRFLEKARSSRSYLRVALRIMRQGPAKRS